ncbi:MAG: MgtC/SapB family protein [Planctomycetia bacterium]|nr:MgtC/SapB family protein [Planctomycetia bacterium]
MGRLESLTMPGSMLPVPDPATLAVQFALAVILGFLVGIQRERAGSLFGIRTFPLITVLGTLSALLTTVFGVWILPAGLLSLTLLGIVAAFLQLLGGTRGASELASGKFESGDQTPSEPESPVHIHGMTTLVTMLVMYCVGAMLANPSWTMLALEAGGLTAVLLQFKLQLHQIARKLGEDDMKAIMYFVMISFVILPILPKDAFGPLKAFNLYETWLMVVLIVGLSLAGYVTYKFFGKQAGILSGGVLGGAVSSTATSVCYTRMAADKSISPLQAAVVMMIANTVMYARLLILAVIVSESFFWQCLGPLSCFLVACFVPALLLWRRVRSENFVMSAPKNPTQFVPAITFGMFYAVIMLLMKLGIHFFGEKGLFAAAGISGLVEPNAVVLSTARLAVENSAIMTWGWRIVLVAMMANLLFKSAIAFFLGGRSFGLYMLRFLMIPALVGLILVFS